MDTPLSPEWVSALTALAAVFLGPVLAWIVTRRQISASARSQSRQAWIDRLRDDLAEYATELATVAVRARFDIIKDAAELQALTQRAQLLRTRVQLILNPAEASHRELLDALERMLDATTRLPSAAHKEQDDDTPAAGRTRLVAAAQTVIKQAWEDVKRLR
ncbi:MAG: hypothetical protein IPO08_05790 [Xanthomonadales bacterium]|nr:hypothetical protein [Xanthomonadales bacterium]